MIQVTICKKYHSLWEEFTSKISLSRKQSLLFIAAGRICLDILKMKPKGSWKPSFNIATVLTSLRLLLTEPNPFDPLMADIANEYQYNRQQFTETARRWTKEYANSNSIST